MEFSRDQLRDAYDHLERWTSWWLDQRDENGDGLCEYTHGNDSGWDNSSAFCELPPVTSPDLNALLVVQMDVLSDIAQKLNMKSDSAMWKERSDFMLKRLLSRLFQNGKPVVLAGLKNSQIQTNSLLPYVSIVLGKKLPEEIRKEMIRTLESKKFITDYGIATESPASNKYVPDGYWLGPIWAPSTMLVLDGMKECGETDFVREMTHRFCRMTQESGFAENFDALTGEGLRDRAYTWTASIMLVMAHEYIESKGE
jgi:glycogen debranching enzyme